MLCVGGRSVVDVSSFNLATPVQQAPHREGRTEELAVGYVPGSQNVQWSQGFSDDMAGVGHVPRVSPL